MKKNIKPISKKKNFILERISTSGFRYSMGTLFIVFFVYSFSLFRPWQPFDERALYNEIIFPYPTRFEEIFEIIKSFAHNAHIVSMNYFFSNHATLRADPATWTILVFMFYFFKKNALLYHLFQLSIHLINALFVWLIFYKTSKLYSTDKNKINYIVISLFTLIWALHSTLTEATLLVTNWNANITYTFCLGFILYEVSKITSRRFSNSKATTMVIIALFFLTTYIAEYSYPFPALIFTLILSYVLKISGSFKKAFSIAFRSTMPYFIGLVFFALHIFFKPSSPLENIIQSSSNISPVYIFIERNLWLTPQIFLNFFKLFFSPKDLSTYKSSLIDFSHNLIEPYTVFCTVFYLCFILLPVILFVLFRKKPYSNIFPLFYVFYFSVFPFLHIILPTYCLIADRYVYFPLFLLLLLLFHVIYKIVVKENVNYSKAIIVVLSCILLLLSFRTMIRIKDWCDPVRFYQAAMKLDKNPLHKAHKALVFADYLKNQGIESERNEYVKKALDESYKALDLFTNYKRNNDHEPVTLKLYGLDYDTLAFKSAFLITTIKNDYLFESPKEILTFFEPYIKDKKHLKSINAITLYAKILSRNRQIKEAKEILDYGLKIFPYSYDILISLINYHLSKNDLTTAYEHLQNAYKYYPYEPILLEKFLYYYSKKNDPLNEARFAYLLGLRIHSIEGYQRAANTYLNINQIESANQSLKKAIRLDVNNPLTLLLTSRYLDLTNRKSKILGILTRAYESSKILGEKQDMNVTKSIILSLISVYSQAGDLNNAKKLLLEFENLGNLTNNDRKMVLDLKNRLR